MSLEDNEFQRECRDYLVAICRVMADKLALEYGGYTARLLAAVNTTASTEDLWTRRLLVVLWSISPSVRHVRNVASVTEIVERYRDFVRGRDSLPTETRMEAVLAEIKQ